MNREPLAIIGAVVALVQALVTTVALMGWVTLTPEQAAGWMGVAAAAAVLFLKFFFWAEGVKKRGLHADRAF